MKTFSNMSYPDLLLIYSSLKMFSILLGLLPEMQPKDFSNVLSTSYLTEQIGELQEQISIQNRIAELLKAIEIELPKKDDGTF